VRQCSRICRLGNLRARSSRSGGAENTPGHQQMSLCSSMMRESTDRRAYLHSSVCQMDGISNVYRVCSEVNSFLLPFPSEPHKTHARARLYFHLDLSYIHLKNQCDISPISIRQRLTLRYIPVEKSLAPPSASSITRSLRPRCQFACFRQPLPVHLDFFENLSTPVAIILAL
jgi:hypothetical protein